jgi:predicted aspartyl protease
MTPRLVSEHFPYLPLRLEVRGRTSAVEALLDTGFDGDVAVPPDLFANGEPDDYQR